MSHPPSPRSFLTALVNSIPHDCNPSNTSSNPLTSLRSAKDRSALLTLHVLFPNELLPALDLLDRALVTRFRIVTEEVLQNYQRQQQEQQEQQEQEHEHEHEQQQQQQQQQEDQEDEQLHGALVPPIEPLNLEPYPTVYHVRSAQAFRRSRHSDNTTHAPSYEVRLDAWNCSCPAFTFAAFPPALTSVRTVNDMDTDLMVEDTEGGDAEDDHEDRARRWGGLTLGEEDAAVCKHLLACVLGERCAIFAGCVQERVVGVEEAAGWAAGWGA